MKKQIVKGWGWHSLAAALVFSLFTSFVGAQEHASLNLPPFKEKSPGTALALSFVGTTVIPAIAILVTRSADSDSGKNTGVIVFLGASCLGPSLGYFYGGLAGRAALGTALRAAGWGLFLKNLAVWGDSGDEATAWIGLGVVAVSTLADLILVYSAVNNKNRRQREERLALAPVYIPQTKAWGVQVRVRF
jgi:hypothetical protein